MEAMLKGGRETKRMMSGKVILNVRNLGKNFGGLQALSNINLYINTYEILGVIGPNGAGKTTLINIITGLIHPTKGRIFFKGMDITYANPEAIASMGIGRTFQNIRLFRNMSVIDNVLTALQLHDFTNMFDVLFSSPKFIKKENNLRKRASEILKSLNLWNFRDVLADSLPYGIQRRVEIARALALNPQLLLLDEPSVGMDPTETTELLNLILDMHDKYKLSIIVVAHDMNFIMKLCHRIQVLNYGKTIAMGLPEEVRTSRQVIEAYLGG